MPDMTQLKNPATQTGPRILYLTKVYPYPPAISGDAVYSRGIIEALAAHCALTVLCADSGAKHGLGQGIGWHFAGPQRSGRAGSIISRWPLVAWKGATTRYHTTFKRLLSQVWDAIVLDNLGLAHGLPLAEAYRRASPRTRLVYVSHEYEHPTRASKYSAYRLGLLKKTLATCDLHKVKRSEEALLRRCDVVTVINTTDLTPFRKIAPARKYLHFAPGYNGPVSTTRQIGPDTPRKLMLLGGRKSEQKRQILLDWLAVSYERLTNAGVEMVIAGDMDDSLRQQIKTRYPKAQVLGFVKDMTALIGSARMGLIADTVGGGFKMRLLSHVFERLPIIGLSDAIDGLPTPKDEGYLGAPNLAALVDLVLEVIDDTDRLNRLQDRAFADCVAQYSWKTRAEAFLKAVTEPESEVLV